MRGYNKNKLMIVQTIILAIFCAIGWAACMEIEKAMAQGVMPETLAECDERFATGHMTGQEFYHCLWLDHAASQAIMEAHAPTREAQRHDYRVAGGPAAVVIPTRVQLPTPTMTPTRVEVDASRPSEFATQMAVLRETVGEEEYDNIVSELETASAQVMGLLRGTPEPTPEDPGTMQEILERNETPLVPEDTAEGWDWRWLVGTIAAVGFVVVIARVIS